MLILLLEETSVSTCYSTESMNWFSLFHATSSRNIFTDTLTTKGYIKIILRTVMADYAIVIEACSKIICHALSRIKTKAMLWILFSGFFAGLFTVYLYLIFLC